MRMKEKPESIEKDSEFSHLGDRGNGNKFWRLQTSDIILEKMMSLLCAMAGLKQQQYNRMAWWKELNFNTDRPGC